tara:strand:- start:2 stop:520 length:519 start_codon:yes stop_codon:yes gene_type:complete
MSAAPAGQNGGGTKKSNKKAIADTEVSAYEKELAKQEAEKKAEANVEMGLGTPSTSIIDGTLSDPREKDDTAAIQAIKDSKKTTTTNIGNGGNDGGNNNTPPPTILKKTAGGQTVQTTEAKVAEDKKEATEYDARQTKKKGRKKNILTSSQGIMTTSADYSLGKKSLLGQVV